MLYVLCTVCCLYCTVYCMLSLLYCVLYAVSSWSTIIIIDKQTCFVCRAHNTDNLVISGETNCNYEFFLVNLSSWRYFKRWKLSRLAALLHCLFKISNFGFLDEVFQSKWTRQVAWPKITWTLFENWAYNGEKQADWLLHCHFKFSNLNLGFLDKASEAQSISGQEKVK